MKQTAPKHQINNDEDHQGFQIIAGTEYFSHFFTFEHQILKKPTTSSKVVKSPFVSTFYHAPAPGANNFADIGKRIKKGNTLYIIKAMKLMNKIKAKFDGVIKEILAENEQPIEFDQPLFVIE